MGDHDPFMSSDERETRSCDDGTGGQRSGEGVVVHRRSSNRSINAVLRANRVRQALARALRAGGILCLAGLSLSNAPLASPGNVRIALAEVAAMPAPTGANARLARDLRQCRSQLDGSFRSLVEAVAPAGGDGDFAHIATDMLRVDGAEVTVVMLFRTGSDEGVFTTRQASASIDLASCRASQVVFASS